MDIGLALDFGRHQGRLDLLMTAYADLLDEASALPLHSVWAGEAFVPLGEVSGHVASPLLVLAALAQMTPAKLGVGVTLLPSWHPTRLAYDTSILDQLCGGRLILGVGVGRAPLWEQFDVSASDVGTYSDEILAACKMLWAGEPGYHGRLVEVSQGIDPLPIQRRGPSIWVGGKAHAALRRAVHLGDAYFAGSSTGLKELSEIGATLRRLTDEAGMDPIRLTVNRIAVITPTDREAAQLAERHLGDWWQVYHGKGLTSGSFDEAVSDMMLIGSPETVAAQLVPYADIGVRHVNMRIAPLGLPLEVARQTLDGLGSINAAMGGPGVPATGRAQASGGRHGPA